MGDARPGVTYLLRLLFFPLHLLLISIFERRVPFLMMRFWRCLSFGVLTTSCSYTFLWWDSCLWWGILVRLQAWIPLDFHFKLSLVIFFEPRLLLPLCITRYFILVLQLAGWTNGHLIWLDGGARRVGEPNFISWGGQFFLGTLWNATYLLPVSSPGGVIYFSGYICMYMEIEGDCEEYTIMFMMLNEKLWVREGDHRSLEITVL